MKAYTIRIESSPHKDYIYMGLIDELPDVIEYGDSFREVVELLADTIATIDEHEAFRDSVPASLSDELELEAAIVPDFHPIAAPRVRALLLAASKALKTS